MTHTHWFEQTSFLPHMHCYLGQQGLIWTMFLTDMTIGLTYLAIALILWRMVKRIKIPFTPIIICFGVFIGACGVTHLMEVWTLWYPHYWISAGVKAVTALASLGTGLYLFKLREPIAQLVESAKKGEAHRLSLQTELRESERRFAGTFEHAAVGLAHVGLDGKWLRLNERYVTRGKCGHEVNAAMGVVCELPVISRACDNRRGDTRAKFFAKLQIDHPGERH